jgi:hypothetical protein
MSADIITSVQEEQPVVIDTGAIVRGVNLARLFHAKVYTGMTVFLVFQRLLSVFLCTY